jgi:hypothetical protein
MSYSQTVKRVSPYTKFVSKALLEPLDEEHERVSPVTKDIIRIYNKMKKDYENLMEKAADTISDLQTGHRSHSLLEVNPDKKIERLTKKLESFGQKVEALEEYISDLSNESIAGVPIEQRMSSIVYKSKRPVTVRRTVRSSSPGRSRSPNAGAGGGKSSG